jgi:hypothetical protein
LKGIVMSKAKSKPPAPRFPPPAGVEPIEPQNAQPEAWAACLKIQSNARLAEKIKTIKSEHTSGEQLLIRKLIKVWAREVGLKEHFPGISDPLIPEIPYYLDYCHRVGGERGVIYPRYYVVYLAHAIVTKDIHRIANIYADWQTAVATTKLIRSLKIGGQVSNITHWIAKGEPEKAIAVISDCLMSTSEESLVQVTTDADEWPDLING